MRILRVMASIWTILAGLVTEAPAQATGRPGVQDSHEFVIREGDILRIRVWPDATLGGDFPVEETGLVYLPVLGEVHVAGRPIGELRRELRRSYADLLRTPVVTVTPVFRVGILGEVARPGLYHIDPTQSLFDLITTAGGFTSSAKQDELRLIRDGRVFRINAKRALETGEALLALELRSGDRLVVPARKAGLSFGHVLLLLQTAVLVLTVVQLAR